MSFYFLYFWCFDILGFGDAEGTAPPRPSQPLEIVKHKAFIHKPANPEPSPQPPPPLWFYTPATIPQL